MSDHSHNHSGAHSHHHNHNHIPSDKNMNRAFVLGIGLNVGFVIIEAVAGFYYNSLALLSDAGHNLTDVTSLLLALFAFRMAKIKPDSKYTYGYRKITVLVSLLNSVFLLVAVGGILWESIESFQNPTAMNGISIAVIAGIGILINGFTAWLFIKDKDDDLNIKGAYLHMAADTLVSVGVLVAGIAIYFTNLFWIDGVVGILIAIIIFFSTIQLLRDSFNLSIDAVPTGIDLLGVKNAMEEVEGVLEVHHIHIWAISTTMNSLTAHIKIEDSLSKEKIISIKKNIRDHLIDQNIHHSTLELEFIDEDCKSGQV